MKKIISSSKWLITILTGIQIFSSCKHECPPSPEEPLVSYAVDLSTDPANVNDTYVSNGFGGNGNPGVKMYLDTRAWTISGTPALWRSFIDFDYSSIPSDAIIENATLYLYADTTYAQLEGHPKGHSQLSGSNAFYLKRVTESWDEAVITWNTAPATDNLHQISLPASTSIHEAYTIDVTDLVKERFINPFTNHGFMLQLQNEAIYRAVVFYSSDCPFTHLRPRLHINYKN